MNPGELDRLITLQVPTTATAANGETYDSFASYGDRWAKMEIISIDEIITDDRLIVKSIVNFTIRFERINEDYRLQYENKTYNINGITEIGRREYLELECDSTEKTNFTT